MRHRGPTARLVSGLTLCLTLAALDGLAIASAQASESSVPAADGAGAAPATDGVSAAPSASNGAPAPDGNAAPATAQPATAQPATAQPAPADGTAAPPPPRPAAKRFPRLKQPSLVHLDQFGLAVLPGSGYRIIAPYQDLVPCGQQNKRVCTGWLPFFIDVQPSFGLTRHWDALVDLRFGVVADFSQSHQFAVAPGFRYWVDPDLDMKFFATFQGIYDLNPQHDPGVKDYDFGVRNANGFMVEVMRNLGFYLQFGETLAFVRWLRFEVDGGIGVQARFP
jgi:hypothetical protein